MDTRFAWLAGCGWAGIFGLSFLVTKSALEAFTPFQILFLRFALATAVLGLLAAIGVTKLRYRGKPKGILALTCLFQPILYFLFETYGVRDTATSTAGLILGAMPAAVAALAVPLLKERLSAPRAAGLLLSVGGVALVTVAGGSDGSDSARGMALVGLALACASFYNIYSRKASAWYGPAEITFAMMASGAAVFGLLALAERAAGGPPLAARLSPGAVGAIAYLGLLSSVLAFFLVNLTLSRLKAAQSAVFGALVPAISLAAGALLRGESVGAAKLLGAAAILAGLWATNAPEKKYDMSCRGEVIE